MARVKPIDVPKGVKVNINKCNIDVEGAKGKLSYIAHELVEVSQKDEKLHVALKKTTYKKGAYKKSLIAAIVGTTCANIRNLIEGVLKGFEKKLLLIGVGFRAQLKGENLNLNLGFSYPVNFSIPEGITLELPSQTEIVVKGIDKQLVGQVAADIRSIRTVEIYKGKGVRYSDEIVVLKETKKK